MGEDPRPGAAAAGTQLHAETNVLAERGECLVLKGEHWELTVEQNIVLFQFVQGEAAGTEAVRADRSPLPWQVQSAGNILQHGRLLPWLGLPCRLKHESRAGR